ncbi:MAG: hypothetical protein AAGI07_18260 [Bacteroidota bacterium]
MIFLKSLAEKLLLLFLLLSSCTSIPRYALLTSEPVKVTSVSEGYIDPYDIEIDLQYVENAQDYLVFNLQVGNLSTEVMLFNPGEIYIDNGIVLYEGFPVSYEKALTTEELLSKIDREIQLERNNFVAREAAGLGVALLSSLIFELTEDDDDNNKENDRMAVRKQEKRELQQQAIYTGVSIASDINKAATSGKIYKLEMEREKVLNRAFKETVIRSQQNTSGAVYLPLVQGNRHIKVFVPIKDLIYEFNYFQKRLR